MNRNAKVENVITYPSWRLSGTPTQGRPLWSKHCLGMRTPRVRTGSLLLSIPPLMEAVCRLGWRSAPWQRYSATLRVHVLAFHARCSFSVCMDFVLFLLKRSRVGWLNSPRIELHQFMYFNLCCPSRRIRYGVQQSRRVSPGFITWLQFCHFSFFAEEAQYNLVQNVQN